MRGLFYSGLFLLAAACLTSCLVVDSGEDPEVVGTAYSKLVGCWVNNAPLCEECAKIACREICFREDTSFTYVSNVSDSVAEVYGKFTDDGVVDKFGLVKRMRSLRAVGADHIRNYKGSGQFYASVENGSLKIPDISFYFYEDEFSGKVGGQSVHFYSGESYLDATFVTYGRTADPSECGIFGTFIHLDAAAASVMEEK